MASMGMAIRKNRRFLIEDSGRSEKSSLWLSLIGESGMGKSPAIDIATQPFNKIQAKSYERFKEEIKAYEKEKTSQPAQKNGKRPKMRIWLTTDSTVESISEVLDYNEGVLLYKRDELAGWFQGMNQYKKTGDERQRWLQLADGQDLTITRVEKDPVIVVDPMLGLMGGMTPLKLSIFQEEDALEDGTVNRFIYEYPLVSIEDLVWDASVCPNYDEYELFFESIIKWSEENRNVELRFNEEARKIWESWKLKNRSERLDKFFPEHLRSYWSKMERYVRKFCIILNAIWGAALGKSFVYIEPDDIQRAIVLSEHYKSQAALTYLHFIKDKDMMKIRRGFDKVVSMGGEITLRQAYRANICQVTNADEARKLFNQWASNKWGEVIIEGKSQIKFKAFAEVKESEMQLA
jgi:hypothetical protein